VQLGIARCVLFFSVLQETLEKRLLQRAESSGRADDNLETILKRFKTFEETSLPVVEHLASKMPVHRISGEQSVEDVYAAVKHVLQL
jgi:adenylate kinase family enzyme